MYFVMKYTVVYCINAPSAAINTCKNVFSFGQREVLCLFTLVTNKGEHSIIYFMLTNVDMVEKGEKKSQAP